jgi:hypothetical protein
MGRVLLIFLLFVSYQLFATDYYFSNSGADGNAGTMASPWESITKMQATINTAVSGDRILLKRGDVWLQSYLYLNAGQNITITDYGTGDMPILSGAKVISMSNIGGSIWRGYDTYLPNASGDIRSCGSVSVNWNFKSMGQEPDSGYFDQIDAGSQISVTDWSKTWTTNQWANAWVIIRQVGTVDWAIASAKVSSNNTTTLTTEYFTFGQSASFTSGNWYEKYYVIVNHLLCLDTQDEWAHYNDYLWLYSSSTPGTVRASVVNNIIEITNGSDLTIENVEINHAVYNGIMVTGATSSVTCDGVVIRGCGRNGIRSADNGTQPNGTYGGRVVFKNGEMARIEAIGIYIANTAVGTGSQIDSNHWHEIGSSLLSNYPNASAGEMGMAQNSCIVWRIAGGTNTFRRNYMHNVRGMATIHNSIPSDCAYDVTDNFIDGYGYPIGDYGGILYANNDSYYAGRLKRIMNNIAINEQPATGAINNLTVPKANAYNHALYTDQKSHGYRLDSNTVQNCNVFYFNNSSSYDTIRYNNVVNALKNMNYSGAHSEYLMFDTVTCLPIGGGSLTGNIVSYNNFVMDGASYKQVLAYQAHTNTGSSWYPVGFTIDYNNYVTNVTDHNLFYMFKNWGEYYLDYTLTEWKAATVYDDSSVVQNRNVAAVKVFKNWSASSHTFDLGSASYTSVTGVAVNTNVTVRPFYSTILFWASGDSTTADPETYMDSALVPMLNYTAPAITDPEIDTLWFAYNDGGFSWEADTACGDTAIRAIYATGSGTADTLASINYCHSTDQDLVGWVEVYFYPYYDSVQLSGDVYLIMPTGLVGGSFGELVGYTGEVDVDNYYLYLPNTDNDPYEFKIRPLDPAYTYEIQLYPSRDNASITGTRKTYLTIGDSTKYVDAVGNTDSIISIQNIDPIDSTITFYVDRQDGNYGYMNAMYVKRTEKAGTQNNYIFFDNVDFSAGIDSARIKIKHGEVADSLSMVMWLDSYGGTFFDSLIITTGEQCYINTLTFTEISGVHDLYVELSDTAERYVWIKFFSDSGFSGVATITYIRVIMVNGVPYFINNKYAIKEED